VDQPQPEQAQQPKKKSSSDRYVKLGFAAAFVLAAGVVLYYQLRGTDLPKSWGDDLAAALAEAQAASPPKRVVVFIRNYPASNADNRMVGTTLKKNKRFLRPFVRVQLRLDSEAPWARTYGVTRAPTMLLISADGGRFHRREGFIGEAEFRTEFLKAPLK
jgi:hypothetical protein